LAPPFIRFENGVAEIVRKYFGDVFIALNFDFPSHEITYRDSDLACSHFSGLLLQLFNARSAPLILGRGRVPGNGCEAPRLYPMCAARRLDSGTRFRPQTSSD
jgi:hypothetical protein